MIFRRLRKALALAVVELRYRGKPGMLGPRRRSIGAKYRKPSKHKTKPLGKDDFTIEGYETKDHHIIITKDTRIKRSQTAPTPGADE